MYPPAQAPSYLMGGDNLTAVWRVVRGKSRSKFARKLQMAFLLMRFRSGGRNCGILSSGESQHRIR